MRRVYVTNCGAGMHAGPAASSLLIHPVISVTPQPTFRPRLPSALPALGLLLCTAGCYVYGPAGRPAREGQRVEAFLNDRGRSELGRFVGAGTRSIDGDVTALGDSSLTISVKRSRSIDGAESEWTGEQVALPLAMLDSVRVRRVSFARSALVVGIAAAAGVLIRGAFSGGVSGGPQRSPVPSPQ